MKITHHAFVNKRLKLGAFNALKDNLHAGDNYLSVYWLRWILIGYLDRTKEFEIFLSKDEETGKYIACCILQQHDYMIPSKKLVSMFVVRKYRRQKVGSKLFRFAKSKSRNKNFFFYTDSKVGISFYNKVKVPPEE